MGYGINAIIGLAWQNSYGTPAGVSSAHWLEVTGDTVAVKKGELLSKAMNGNFDESPSYEGKNTVEGDLSMEGKVIDLGYFLKAALGPPTSVTSGSIYTHTFKPRTSDFDDKCAQNPFTLFKNLSVGSGDVFSDLNGNTLELSISEGEYLTAKLGILGGVYSYGLVTASSYFTSTRLTWDISSLSIGGSAADFLKQLTVTFDNKLQTMHTLRTSRTPAYIKRNDFRTVSVGGTMRFTSLTEKQAFINQSERNLTLTMTTGSNVASGYFETLTVILPAFRYTEHPDAANGPTDLEVAFSGKAKYLTSSATAGQVTLVNTRSTY